MSGIGNSSNVIQYTSAQCYHCGCWIRSKVSDDDDLCTWYEMETHLDTCPNT